MMTSRIGSDLFAPTGQKRSGRLVWVGVAAFLLGAGVERWSGQGARQATDTSLHAVVIDNDESLAMRQAAVAEIGSRGSRHIAILRQAAEDMGAHSDDAKDALRHLRDQIDD